MDDDVLSIIVKYQKESKIEFLSDAINQFIREKASSPSQPQSDVPMGKPLNPDKQALIERINQPDKIPPPPCNLASKETWIDPKTNIEYVFCRHPKYTTKGKPEAKITIGSCIEHWKGRQWGFQKRQREREERQEKEAEKEQEHLLEQQPPTSRSASAEFSESPYVERQRKLMQERKPRFLRWQKCLNIETIFPYEKVTELMTQLPCLQDPTLWTKCGFDTCRKNLIEVIKSEAPELIEVLAKKTIATYQQST